VVNGWMTQGRLALSEREAPVRKRRGFFVTGSMSELASGNGGRFPPKLSGAIFV